MRDAVDLFLTHLFGNLFDHIGLVDLIGDLINDDGPTVFANFLNPRLGAHHNTAAPLKVGFARTRTAQHHAPCGEVGAWDMLDQLLGGQIRFFD